MSTTMARTKNLLDGDLKLSHLLNMLALFSPVNVDILNLVGLSLLLILLPVLSPVEKEKDWLMVSCGLFPSMCQCFYYLSISFFIAQQTFKQSSDN